MNIKRGLLRGFFLCAAAATLSSCLFYSHEETILQPEAERRLVKFESDTALVKFQNCAAARYKYGGGVTGTTDFCFPFLMSVSEKEILSENAYYNLQVDKADVDRDGVITQAEADAYSGH